MSQGISNTFPINDRPLGPGVGYGDLDFLPESQDLRYRVNAITETVAPIGMTKWKSIFELPSIQYSIFNKSGQ